MQMVFLAFLEFMFFLIFVSFSVLCFCAGVSSWRHPEPDWDGAPRILGVILIFCGVLGIATVVEVFLK